MRTRVRASKPKNERRVYGVDYEGIVKGMVSGLAAVGLHQVFKQHMKLELQTSFNGDGDDMYEVTEDEDQNRMSEEE